MVSQIQTIPGWSDRDRVASHWRNDVTTGDSKSLRAPSWLLDQTETLAEIAEHGALLWDFWGDK